MSITVVSSAASEDFTTLARVKEALEISSTADDAFLSTLIVEASDLISQYTGRRWPRETVEEKLGASGTPSLMLSRTPVQSVDWVQLDGSSVASTSYEIEDADAGILFREDGWQDTRFSRAAITLHPTSRYKRKDLTVRYEAGYVMPGEGGRDLPWDVEKIAVAIVRDWYFSRDTDPNVKAESIGDVSVNYASGRTVSPSVFKALARYQRSDF